ATEQLRHAVQLEIQRRLEQSCPDTQRHLPQAVARKSPSDQGVVVRPDRAVMISNRVVARLGGGARADAPARERTRTQQGPGHATGALRMDDAREQTLARIGSPYPAGTLVPIQRQGVGG